jgi:hypothetical protein
LINNLIDEKLNEMQMKQLDSRLIWEILKYEIKQKSITFSKNIAKERKSRLEYLENKLKQLQTVQNIESNSELLAIEKEIEQIYSYKAIGSQIRAKLDFIEFGEKNNKLFLNLEKSRQTRKSINTLLINGKKITDIKQILSEEEHFYKKLYTSEKSNVNEIKTYLSNVTFENTLKTKEADACDGKITYKECQEAINDMKLNKSPGLDGLTAEFYKTFFSKIGHILTLS